MRSIILGLLLLATSSAMAEVPSKVMPPGMAAEPLAPVPIERVAPFMPDKAYLEGVDGKAEVQAVVDNAGEVIDVKILSENPEGYGFGEAVAEAVRQWTFEKQRPGVFVVKMSVKNDPNDEPVLAPPDAMPLKYPRRALEREKEGEALLSIVLGDGGHVVDVSIAKEMPSGYGFGDAAKAAVSDLIFPRAKPGRYQITIRFRLG